MLPNHFSPSHLRPYTSRGYEALSNPTVLEGSYGICSFPYINLRESPSDSAELSGQILFGEPFIVREVNGSNTFVARLLSGLHDENHSSMSGWIDSHVAARLYVEKCDALGILKAEETYLVGVRETEAQPLDKNIAPLRLSFGSILPNYDPFSGEFNIGNQRYLVSPNEVGQKGIDPTTSNFLYVYNTFEGTEYLWGGSTIYGTDCAGFTQTAARFFGVDLPRDSLDQSTYGEEVSLEQAMTGDLVFIKTNPASKKIVNHVGFLGRRHDGKLLLFHAKQTVRCDQISICADGLIVGIPESPLAQLVSIRRIAKFRSE